MRDIFNKHSVFFIIVGIGFVGLLAYFAVHTGVFSRKYVVSALDGHATTTANGTSSLSLVDGTGTSLAALTPIDTAAYDAKLLAIANIPPRTITLTVTSTIPGYRYDRKIKNNKDRPRGLARGRSKRSIRTPARFCPSIASSRTTEILFHADGSARSISSRGK